MRRLQNLLFTFCIALRCVTSAVGVIHVTGYVGSAVKVSCSYDQGYESYEKYLCKNDCGSNDDVLITTSNPVTSKYRIHDDKTARIFTTSISDLRSVDAGKYWCGVTRTGIDIYTEVKLKLVQDSCCNSVTKIESYAGYSVSFSCPYESRYQNNLKYICRGTRPSTCLQQALITSYNKENGRFRLNDENMSTKFTTKISSLTQSDSGRYLCGIQRNSDLHLFCAFELKVKDHCCDTVTNIESYEGYSESINCLYENQYQNNLKYICRGNQPSTCLQDALITSNNRENGRFRLNDVKMSRIFTVTISNLTQSDSGHYLCGVQTNSDHDVFSAVELRVKEWCCVRSTKITGTVGQPLTLQCPYPQQHRDNRKFLCKGDHRNSCRDMVTSQNRFALQADIYSNSFSVTITKIQADDAGTYWCGSDSQWRVGNYTKIQLSVGARAGNIEGNVNLLAKEFSCVKSAKINGTVGHPLTLQCPYPSQYRDNRKFLCKGDHRNNCTDMLKNQSRFTLQDASSSTFIVIISKLETADAGTYWCGSDSQWRVGNYTKIQLSVFPQSTLGKKNPALYVIPPVLLLICILVLVYKYRHSRIEEAVLSLRRNASRKKSSKKVIGAAQSEIYKNQGVVTSNDQSTSNVYEEVDVEVHYENLTASE
ncbi:polymeric immunoglobulin receptor-like isoform X3 [Simochromis diagramma]|uniref:polymeric immunoglobulin receptor-like isoform X3 n=1 Tax=Simochromis diagramma TaxID=43689 RepID=UPI001A7ED94B|nr:polymeric immunoglobulin receptor-like isoform X3 [Simochromis diagramma]